ncbi:MAG: AMP-binding protein [Deltaproteobacteria bacterium]|nr:AMP-binding protein [Deltaproteobacteria bacterium]MBW1936017.1 AMP-binding protein [Deltaproteobacteria bacterium]MBW1977580.1 AMP-binding protein [Deltaproteobacteria bacterium]MBW2044012.1 AMP-binding protein [Deltaproteobacteria bacterium]MBW2298787.1 AMP-binding protein [Deltaproteobacteria bacterium]
MTDDSTKERYGKIGRIDKEFLSSMENYTFPQVLSRQAEKLGSERIAIREKAYGIWQAYSWKEYFSYTKRVALGMKSLGLARGENVGLILDNHPEWLFTELGTQSVGGVVVPLFTSAVAKELVYGLNRVEAAYVFAQDQEQVDKLLETKDEIGHVRRVIYVDPTGMRNYRNNPWLISFSELLDLGDALDREEPELFMKELWEGKPSDVSIMLMTSGTTGLPKLVMLSYENFIDMSRKWLETAPIGIGDNWISITPTAWIVDQLWGMGITLCGGMAMNFPETLETAVEDFREIGPTVIVTSSRFWEDLASTIRVKISDAGFIKQALYNWSQKVGGQVVDLESQGKPVPAMLRFLSWITTRVVSRPLMDRVGCLGFRAAYTGGHPISPDVIRFFRANGLNLKQCYGLTEAGGIFQVQPDDEVKPETVGIPLPRTEVRIGEDQEVLVSSKSTFVGYYQNPEATAEALKDGWFHTGDAGYLDDDGHLLIIGRKEDIMRTREGEAFSPDFIETRLKFSPYIKEAVIWGEGRPYLTAFINIDFGNVGNWAEDRKIPYTTYTDLSQQPAVEELIRQEVRQVNKQIPKPMQLEKIILLYKLLDADDQELTRTGKVRRKFVFEQYKDLIDAMYSDKTELPVKGEVRYRDGHVGIIETTVRILTV